MADATAAPGIPEGLLPWGRSLLTGACALAALGLAFGVFPFLVVAVLLGAAAVSGRAMGAPRASVDRHASAPQVRSGDDIGIATRVAWDAGAAGAVVAHDAVPDALPLSRGANLHAFALDAAPAGEMAFGARATRRGVQRFGPAHLTFPDPLGAGAARVVKFPQETEVVVLASAPAAPHVKSPTAWGATLLPAGDRASRGVATNDFRELRPYEPGDPLKSVNWKATARASTGDMRLVVNQFEVEGKKAIWIFLDASWYTAGGTSARTTFDELSGGALAVARHFLDRGHRVGFTLYGASDEPKVVHPDAGSTQERRLANLLTFTEPAHAPPAEGARASGLGAAVERTRGFLARERPVSFVFTLVGRDPSLSKAVTEVRALSSTGRRPGIIAVLAHAAPDPRGGIPARLVAIRERLQSAALERRGVRVARWDSSRAPLAALLMRGVMR